MSPTLFASTPDVSQLDFPASADLSLGRFDRLIEGLRIMVIQVSPGILVFPSLA